MSEIEAEGQSSLGEPVAERPVERTGVAPERRTLLRVLIHPSRPVVMGFSVTIGILLAAGVALTVVSLSTVLMSLTIAMFLALAMDPLVKNLQARGVRRSVGIGIVTAGFLVIVAVIVFIVVPLTVRQLIGVIEGIPATISELVRGPYFTALEAFLDLDLEALLRELVSSVTSVGNFLAVSGGVLRAATGVIGGVSSTVLIVVLTLYFVSSLRAIKGALVSLVPAY